MPATPTSARAIPWRERATARSGAADAARAYVTLWLAEKTADARTEQAELVGRLEAALQGRIDVGSAPMVEGLRLRAEHLRAAADAREAATLVDGAGAELGRWLGVSYGPRLRARDEPPVPRDAPSLATLLARVPRAPAVRREEADERAAEARAARERALVRPGMTLDLSVEAYDPTLPATNYRAQLAVELPLFNQRGAYVERELSAAAAARARAAAENTRAGADLVAAYQQFVAVSERVTALEQAVVPAADAAAAATEDAYGLGRSPLVAVLDAEKARIDARLSLLEGRAVRAIAWVDVERALGERGP